MATTTAYWQKLLDNIRKQPQKAAVLGVLGLLMLVLWGRQMLQGGPSPARAAAAPAVVKPLARIPNAQERAAQALQEWLEKHPAPVGRNLFAIKLDYFPRDGSQINQVLREPSGNGFWDQLAKSMTARTDLENRRKVLIENLRLQAAQRLRLESTMLSHGHPRALVNGKLVSEGDVVAGFRLVRIEARRMIVEREGIKLEVLFQ